MYPDSSYAAFYQHSKAFLGHVKNLLERRRFGGTGPRLDQVFCRVGKMPPLQAQGWHSPLHVAWSIFASARPPLSSSWTEAICALARSAQLSSPQLNSGTAFNCFSGVSGGIDEAKDSAAINHAMLRNLCPSNPLQDAA